VSFKVKERVRWGVWFRKSEREKEREEADQEQTTGTRYLNLFSTAFGK
jgi:hypothetical protein